MMRVRDWIDGFAGVAPGALPIIEAALERLAEDIAITLRMRIVAVHASHRAFQITVAVKMRGLIAEAAHASIDGERIREDRQSE